MDIKRFEELATKFEQLFVKLDQTVFNLISRVERIEGAIKNGALSQDVYSNQPGLLVCIATESLKDNSNIYGCSLSVGNKPPANDIRTTKGSWQKAELLALRIGLDQSSLHPEAAKGITVLCSAEWLMRYIQTGDEKIINKEELELAILVRKLASTYKLEIIFCKEPQKETALDRIRARVNRCRKEIEELKICGLQLASESSLKTKKS